MVQKSPSSSFRTTIALGLCTFFYVQFNSIKHGGLKGWLHHLLGSPTDKVTWALSPLFLFLEVVGELVKPFSLSLRLFGNIFGEDKVLAIFLGLGMMLSAAIFRTVLRRSPPLLRRRVPVRGACGSVSWRLFTGDLLTLRLRGRPTRLPNTSERPLRGPHRIPLGLHERGGLK